MLTVDTKLELYDFAAMVACITNARVVGGFIADGFSLFHEELKAQKFVPDDRIGKLQSSIFQHFQNGRDLLALKYFAILGVVPSTGIAVIRLAR